MSHPGKDAPIGHPYIILSTIDSTNNYAMRQIQAGLASHGTTWFAMEQTAGKGQRGKSWLTTPNQNIMLSAVVKPALLPSRQFWLSATVALACYDFYKKHAGDETAIKWPNDVYWRDRKAGGILIENIFRGTDWLYAVVGIGINVNQVVFDPSLPNPVSLKQITGKEFDAAALGQELCQALENRYRQLHSGGIETIMEEYQQVLYKLHQPVTLKKGAVLFETTITGVSDSGQLLTKDVMERAFDFGEVELVIK
ncbi:MULTISPECIES: biotin--[acetyl-CoA-carboxylase] ligase [Niastella]|uniref:Biotin--[acetyl-CoA-carboxylase] ligase n=1 Tax=Niastella soli TaxID=2821487 RepID=A0ABS3YMW5_9BACT|nr:biotin--[acetyl-CoA-carboxylase] ligase [Niastella soli]MBO9199217.1 biotin--[acetyl-CoA-carboxylase] ligase [Niastella soli]